MSSTMRHTGTPAGGAAGKAGPPACEGTTGGENEEPRTAGRAREERAPST